MEREITRSIGILHPTHRQIYEKDIRKIKCYVDVMTVFLFHLVILIYLSDSRFYMLYVCIHTLLLLGVLLCVSCTPAFATL